MSKRPDQDSSLRVRRKQGSRSKRIKCSPDSVNCPLGSLERKVSGAAGVEAHCSAGRGRQLPASWKDK